MGEPMASSARTALPEPVAPRLRAPTWRDPRLLFGILLVAGSVVLGSWVITTGQETVGIYQVTETITPGTPVTEQNLVVTQIRASDVQDRYLMASEGMPLGQVSLRVLGAGEFVPRAAIGDVAAMEHRPISIPVGSDLSSTVAVGSLVDLWFVPDTSRNATVDFTQDDPPSQSQEPYRLAQSLVVSEVSVEGGLIAGSGASVHVLVPQDDLGEVLGALSAQGRVNLVPGFGGK